ISWGEFFSAAGLGGDRLLRLTGNIQVAALTAGAAIAGDFQAGFGLLGSATVENFPNPPGVHHTHLKAGFFGVAGPSAAATNYIGFKAYANSQTYYGWLRIKVQNGADGLPSQISLVAKDGEPAVFGAFGLASDNVLAGQSFGTAIPEPANVPGGLALLALGAAGVREFRKRRKSAA
ncbi:MAG TPA: hypothetical protein VHE13_10395, partial [Opitutus sp.]|nr:hypothetical protein [Opitutus sp.]